MIFEPLNLSHKNLLSGKLAQIGTFASEYSFANLYLFRRRHSYEVIQSDKIFIRGKSYDGKKYLMPVFVPSKEDAQLFKRALKEFGADFIFPVPEEWLIFFGPDFACDYLDGDSDYIFSHQKIATFAGHKLHNKRNLLKIFERDYLHEGRPLTKELIPQAMAILDAWQSESSQAKEETDYEACLEALELYDELSICGGIFYADGMPAGFVIGEEIRSDQFVLHFVKGLKSFRGLYQFMFSNFVLHLPEKYVYINFEQDLGVENLRKAKRSYLPDIILKKCRVRAL